MEIFKNKKIYIAPKTPISLAFKEHLSNFQEFEFLGFLDKIKDDDDVSRIENILEQKIDYIIIISPNHDRVIYQEYQKFIDSKKIKVINIKNNCYHLLGDIKKNRDSKIEEYSKEIDCKNIKREGVSFISKGFIDSNNKYLLLYLLEKGIKSCILTDNKEQIKELKKFKIPFYELESDEGDKAIASAKYLVFDQANYTYLFVSSAQKTIQLWHGIGLKRMSKLTNIVYDYFISTSDWTNETNFKKIFCAKEYLDCGYPRNDIFFKEEKPIDLIFCNKEIYSLVNNKSYKKVILYMPTIREYLFNKSINLTQYELVPINFYHLNETLSEKDTLFIVKFHPSVIEFFKEFIIKEKFSHIVFHPTQGDIYPIIKYIDILVSDYSSIVYDFLLLNKPIIFFDYDRVIYEKNMGGFLFDYDEYSPGIKVSNQNELVKALFEEDSFEIERINILSKFFTKNKNLSSSNILDIILKNN